MSDGDSVSYREFKAALDSIRDEIEKSEKFLIDNISGARVALLKEIENVERRTNLSSDKALSALNVRLETMNEFRNQINSERANFVTRDMLDIILAGLRNDKTKKNENTWTKSGIIILAAGTVASVIISLIALLR